MSSEVPAVQAEKKEPKGKVGQRVEVVDAFFAFRGVQGVITAVDDYETVKYRVRSGSPYWYQLSYDDERLRGVIANYWPESALKFLEC